MDRVVRSGGIYRPVGLAIALSLSLAGGVALAQSAAPGTVTNLIVANLDKPKAICKSVAPVVASSPGSFGEVISASQTYPELLEPLGECCAVIQKSLKKNDPEAAKTVSDILVSGPAAFQAVCAVSLADSGGTQVIASSAGTDGGSGTSGVGYGGGLPGGGGIGGGGGVVSPSAP